MYAPLSICIHFSFTLLRLCLGVASQVDDRSGRTITAIISIKGSLYKKAYWILGKNLFTADSLQD